MNTPSPSMWDLFLSGSNYGFEIQDDHRLMPWFNIGRQGENILKLFFEITKLFVIRLGWNVPWIVLYILINSP